MSHEAAATSRSFVETFEVASENVKYTDEYIRAQYVYDHSMVFEAANGKVTVQPVTQKFEFQTGRKVPKLGMMLVGWGGNNGSTLTGAIVANKGNISWATKRGVQEPNYWGSITQASTSWLGTDQHGREIFTPLRSLLPMVNPNDVVVGGWDISSANMADAVARAGVFEVELQRELRPHLEGLTPLPAPYYPDFIAANQESRADNVLPGANKKEHLEKIRQDIRDFKASNGLDKVIAGVARFALL